jgi:hypothetical protein
MPERELSISEKKIKAIGKKLKGDFNETESRRQNFREDAWLEDLRQYKGIYDPEVLDKIGPVRSKVYPRYTRSKVQPLIAKLNDTLFPDNDRNWEILPTPKPEISKEEIDFVIEHLSLGLEPGEELTPQDVEKGVMEYVKATAQRMTVTVDDQLLESNYKAKAKAVIRSSVMYGTGIFKGPLSKGHISRKIVKTDNGYNQEEKKGFKPVVDNVLIWKWFPDMSSTEFEHCNFVFELHAMTKHELRKLGRRKNFKNDVITEYIKSHKKGDYKLRQWEIDLKTIKEQEDVQESTNKYEVLEYNGYLDGHDLLEAGIIKEGDEVEKDWFVNIWLLGNEVIKAIIHPIESLTDLYHIFYFDKDDSSIFGEGLPRIIRDTQISICSATRAMLDNAAWVAGPIFETNTELMPDEELDDIYPGRQLEREGRGLDAQTPALRVHQIDSRMSEYLAIIGKFERNGDMESTVPAFLFGEAAKTTNETSKGISIRQSNTNLTINDIVKNFDEPNESLVRNFYAWNLEYNPDKTIKGDMNVKAVGSSSLVSKEQRTQALDFFAQTLQPEDKPFVKNRVLLEERAKAHDLDPEKLLYSEEEAQANIEAASDSEAVELEKLRLEADIGYTDAKAANMNSKAQATVKKIGNEEIDTMINALTAIKQGRQDVEKRSE